MLRSGREDVWQRFICLRGHSRQLAEQTTEPKHYGYPSPRSGSSSGHCPCTHLSTNSPAKNVVISHIRGEISTLRSWVSARHSARDLACASGATLVVWSLGFQAIFSCESRVTLIEVYNSAHGRFCLSMTFKSMYIDSQLLAFTGIPPHKPTLK